MGQAGVIKMMMNRAAWTDSRWGQSCRPLGRSREKTLLFQTLAPPTWSAPRSAVDTLQMKPAAPALPGGAGKTQSDRINGWNNEEEETAGRWLHLRVWDCRGCGRKALQSEDRATNVIWGEDENAFKKPNSVSRWDKTRRSEAGTAPRGSYWQEVHSGELQLPGTWRSAALCFMCPSPKCTFLHIS